jgi:1-acyl-sn-glycerol-3-phosphate acyltransferase
MFFWFIRSLSVPLGRLLFRTTVTGAENIPLGGPVMLVANHQSNLDPIFLVTANPRRVFAMGKSELFINPWSKWFYLHLGAFPIKRGQPDRKGLKKILDLFYEGNVVLIFPEGGRNHEPGLGSLEPGVVFMADMTGVPILPAGITGTSLIWPKGAKFPRFPRVRVRFGHVFKIEDFAPRAAAKTTAEKRARQEVVLTRIRKEIEALSDDAF